jgi:hypothetical protein
LSLRARKARARGIATGKAKATATGKAIKKVIGLRSTAHWLYSTVQLIGWLVTFLYWFRCPLLVANPGGHGQGWSKPQQKISYSKPSKPQKTFA